MRSKYLNLKGYGYVNYGLLICLNPLRGAMCKIIEELARKKIRILFGMHTQSGNKASWISFLEVPHSVSIEETVEKIASMSGVAEIKRLKTDGTDKFEKFLFPFHLFCSKRVIIMPDYIFHDFKKILIDILRTGGESIIYMQGVNSGRDIASRIKENFGEELITMEDFLHIIEDAFRALGFGTLEFREINPKVKTGSIIVRDSVDCFGSPKIKCHFVRGFVTGMLKKIFNDETIEIVEIKCISEGDPVCEFRFL